MQEFINIINELTEDVFYSKTSFDIPAQRIYTEGGCYELYKIVKYYYPSVELYEQNDDYHVIFLYNDEFYDTNGIRIDYENFSKVTQERENQISDLYGGKFWELQIASSVINYLNQKLLIWKYTAELETNDPIEIIKGYEAKIFTRKK